MPADQTIWLYALIIGCEIGFWVVLVLALAVRYLVRNPPLSKKLLLMLPVVDLLLLAFTAMDLASGSSATVAHGLATAYLGFTIAFGSSMVKWADSRFAHHFAGGPPPTPTPKYGVPAFRYEMRAWLRSLVAWAIAAVLLFVLIAVVDNAAKASELWSWFPIAGGAILLWFLFGPLWVLLFSMRPPKS